MYPFVYAVHAHTITAAPFACTHLRPHVVTSLFRCTCLLYITMSANRHCPPCPITGLLHDGYHPPDLPAFGSALAVPTLAQVCVCIWAHAFTGTCHNAAIKLLHCVCSIWHTPYMAHAIVVTYLIRVECLFLYSQAFAWSSDSIGRARELFGDAAFVGRSLTMSSAYSGIGTVEQAAHQICNNLSSTPGCGSHSVHSTWALEKDDVCRAELASYFSDLGSDSCVFCNLIELIPDSWWPDLGFGPNAKELKPLELYAKRLHHATLILDGQACTAHVGCHTCKLGHSDLHVAGTTCVDHSSYGSCTGSKQASKQASKQVSK